MDISKGVRRTNYFFMYNLNVLHPRKSFSLGPIKLEIWQHLSNVFVFTKTSCHTSYHSLNQSIRIQVLSWLSNSLQFLALSCTYHFSVCFSPQILSCLLASLWFSCILLVCNFWNYHVCQTVSPLLDEFKYPYDLKFNTIFIWYAYNYGCGTKRLDFNHALFSKMNHKYQYIAACHNWSPWREEVAYLSRS